MNKINDVPQNGWYKMSWNWRAHEVMYELCTQQIAEYVERGKREARFGLIRLEGEHEGGVHAKINYSRQR